MRTSLDGLRTAERRRRIGFTMIEMLVVVVIILILTGIIYRISAHYRHRAGRARTAYQLELMLNIMEEYYAVYGHYPPSIRSGATSGGSANNAYEDYEDRVGQNIYPPDWPYYRNDPLVRPLLPIYQDPSTYGLTFYLKVQFDAGLVPGVERTEYQRRWRHYFDEISTPVSYQHVDFGLYGDFDRSDDFQGDEEGGGLDHSNRVFRIVDPYGKDWVYVSSPPDYQSYQLYSSGPGERAGGPIGKDRWSE